MRRLGSGASPEGLSDQTGAHRRPVRRGRRHRRAGALPRAGPRTAAAANPSSSRTGRGRGRRPAAPLSRAPRPTATRCSRPRARRFAFNPSVYKKLPYDPLTDFSLISLIAAVPFVLVVNPSLPVNSVAELVALAKSKPGELSYASGGMGAPHHIYMELLKSMTGTDIKHIPYRGGGPALNDVVAGHVPMMFGDVGPVTGLHTRRPREGARRHGRQAGRDHSRGADADRGRARRLRGEFLAKHGRARRTCRRRSSPRLNKALTGVLAEPATREHFLRLGMQPLSSTPRGIRRLSARRDQEMGADHQGGRRDRGLRSRTLAIHASEDRHAQGLHHRAGGSVRDRLRCPTKACRCIRTCASLPRGVGVRSLTPKGYDSAWDGILPAAEYLAGRASMRSW